MIASDFLMNGGVIPKASIAGLVSAHIYHYFTTVYPSQGGRRYLQTPGFLKRIFPSSTRGGFGNQHTRANNTNMFGRHSWGAGHRLGS